jgi:hypothetical protein
VLVVVAQSVELSGGCLRSRDAGRIDRDARPAPWGDEADAAPAGSRPLASRKLALDGGAGY